MGGVARHQNPASTAHLPPPHQLHLLPNRRLRTLPLSSNPRLTTRTPIRRPRLLPLLAHHHRRTASTALLPLPPIHPNAIALCHSMRRPARPAIRHNPLATLTARPTAIGHIRLHILLRDLNHLLQLALIHRPHLPPRIHPRRKRHLALINIPQPPPSRADSAAPHQLQLPDAQPHTRAMPSHRSLLKTHPKAHPAPASAPCVLRSSDRAV